MRRAAQWLQSSASRCTRPSQAVSTDATCEQGLLWRCPSPVPGVHAALGHLSGLSQRLLPEAQPPRDSHHGLQCKLLHHHGGLSHSYTLSVSPAPSLCQQSTAGHRRATSRSFLTSAWHQREDHSADTGRQWERSQQQRQPAADQSSHAQPGPRLPLRQPSATGQAVPRRLPPAAQARTVAGFGPGPPGMRQSRERPEQEAASQFPFQGLNIEADDNVRMVAEDGQSHKVMALSAALKAARRERMDLLPVAPHARPPVFRLGDANEAARQARLRERDSRKKEMENRRKTSMKEVRIGPNTQENDLKMKLDKAKEMVERKYRVRLFIPFKNQHREAAARMLQRLNDVCTGFANVAGPALGERLPTNTVVVYLSPKA